MLSKLCTIWGGGGGLLREILSLANGIISIYFSLHDLEMQSTAVAYSLSSIFRD